MTLQQIFLWFQHQLRSKSFTFVPLNLQAFYAGDFCLVHVNSCTCEALRLRFQSRSFFLHQILFCSRWFPVGSSVHPAPPPLGVSSSAFAEQRHLDVFSLRTLTRLCWRSETPGVTGLTLGFSWNKNPSTSEISWLLLLLFRLFDLFLLKISSSSSSSDPPKPTLQLRFPPERFVRRPWELKRWRSHNQTHGVTRPLQSERSGSAGESCQD